MITVSFLYPKLLLLLFLVPVLIIIYFLSILYNKKKAIIFPNFGALERVSDVEIFSKNYLALYLNVIILILLVLAVSGMSISFNARTSSFSYVIAVDDSWSMKSLDISPNRLDAAKVSAKRFIDMLPTATEIGVISFSGSAEVLQEISNSKLKAKMSIDSIEFGEVQGTNVYNALITANKLFGDRKLKSVILISDGQINVGDTPQILKYTEKNSIIIDTIAIGTEVGGLTEFNTISKVDKDFLKALAFNTGGKFFEANSLENLDESFSSILNEVDKKVSLDISAYLLFVAIFLLCINWFLHNFRFRVVP